MLKFNAEVFAANGAAAKMVTTPEQVAIIDIDPLLKWDRAGLLQLSAILAGLASMLPVTNN